MKNRILLATTLLAMSCTAVEPPVAMRIAQPNTPPMRNFTSFDAALRCMDDLLLAHKRPRVLVSSTGFPDRTKSVNVSGDDMLIGAINTLNRRSGAFAFLDQAREVASGQIKYITESSRLKPKIYVRGAISQFDNATVNASDSAGLGDSSTPIGSAVRTFNISRSRILSIVTVDMHLVSNPGRVILPGMSVSNSMVVMKNTFGGSATGLISLAPLNVGVSIAKVESSGQAVRNLIELGTIELLGKYARVPYWTCLGSAAKAEKTRPVPQKSFEISNDRARTALMQNQLAQLGLLQRYTSGKLDAATSAAIIRFQTKHNLIPSGQINAALAEQLRRAVGITGAPAPVSRPGATGTLRIAGPARDTLVAGQSIRISLTADQNVYVSCYHRSGDGPIVRVFPTGNRPSAMLRQGEILTIPQAGAPFMIVLEPDTAEQILCLSQQNDQSASYPAALQAKGLTPLAAASLNAVLSAHNGAGGGTVNHKFVRYAPAN